MLYGEAYPQIFALVRERRYRAAIRACDDYEAHSAESYGPGLARGMKADIILRAGGPPTEFWHWVHEATPLLRTRHAWLARLYIVAVAGAAQHADEPLALEYADRFRTLYPHRPPPALKARLLANLSVVRRGQCDWAGSLDYLQGCYHTASARSNEDAAQVRQSAALWAAWTCAQATDRAGVDLWLRRAGRQRSSRCNEDLRCAVSAERYMLCGAMEHAGACLSAAGAGPVDKGAIAVLYERVKLAALTGRDWISLARSASDIMTEYHHQWAVEPLRSLARALRREERDNARMA